MITLITCGDLQATTRIAVQGTLAATTPIKDANDDMLKAFQLSKNFSRLVNKKSLKSFDTFQGFLLYFITWRSCCFKRAKP